MAERGPRHWQRRGDSTRGRSSFYSFAIRLVSPIIHPAALAELAEAVAFYEDRASGLGRDLLEEVERVLDIILENPEVAPVFEAPYRR